MTAPAVSQTGMYSSLRGAGETGPDVACAAACGVESVGKVRRGGEYPAEKCAGQAPTCARCRKCFGPQYVQKTNLRSRRLFASLARCLGRMRRKQLNAGGTAHVRRWPQH
jgi:hypothetical protein